MPTLPPNQRSATAHLALEIAGVLVAAWLGLYHLQFLTPYIPDTDGHYHIKAAELLRERGALDTFPWASLSLWAERYFNKDFGFHLLLVPFTYGDLAAGAKLAAVTYGSAVFASLYAVLRLRGITVAWFWTLLLAGGGSYFLWRVNVPRPQIFSITLTLWCLYAVLRRAAGALFVLSGVYALSYTAPIVAVGYAVLHALACRATEGRWLLRPTLAAASGVLTGWLVHPNFPNTFESNWIQLVGVLGSAWGGGGPNLHLGREIFPMPSRDLLVEQVSLFGPAALAATAATRLRGQLSAERITLIAVALGYFVLTCLSKRFVEYLMPVGLWCCAELLHAAAGRWRAPGAVGALLQRRAIVMGALLLLGATAVARSYPGTRREFLSPRPSRLQGAAHWLAAHTPADSRVFTCDWDDAPELFFYNTRNRYLVFLDPSYMYRWSPRTWHTWHDAANNRVRDPVGVIRDALDADYGVCTSNFTGLRHALLRHPTAKITYDDGNAFAFDLTGAAPAAPASGPAAQRLLHESGAKRARGAP